MSSRLRAAAARLRRELGGLTTRGRSFISAGAASALCALVLGQEDLLRIAVLLVLLPLACVAFLARARYRIGLSRVLTPHRVVAGSPVRVRLEVQNLARAGAQVLLAEDETPPELGPATRFVLARLGSGRRVAVTYSVRAAVRGRYAVGPMRLQVGDPFGLCETSRAFTSVSTLTVLPAQWPLTVGNGGGAWGGSGDSLTRSAATHGEGDVAAREYRDGDEMRRIHWRSTAKRGQLMVRREEQPRQLRASIVLDSRAGGHRGEAHESSFEWAVRMAASVVTHLDAQQFGVRLLTDGTPSPWTRPQASEETAALQDRLAVCRLVRERARPAGAQPDDALGSALAQLHRTRGDGLVVAVLGEVRNPHLDELVRLGRSRVPCVALLLQVPQWGAGPVAERQEVPSLVEVRRRLHDAGWLVAEAGSASNGTQVWQEATGQAWGRQETLQATAGGS